MVSGGRLASGGDVARGHSIYRALRASAHAMGLGVGIALFGCGSEDELAESAVEPPAVVEEFSVEDLVIGDGPECQSPSEIVTIHYRGMLLDGQVFDSSYERGAPIVASLDSLIPGWQQGMPGMRIGGKRRLTVPADLAYSGMAAVQAVTHEPIGWSRRSPDPAREHPGLRDRTARHQPTRRSRKPIRHRPQRGRITGAQCAKSAQLSADKPQRAPGPVHGWRRRRATDPQPASSSGAATSRCARVLARTGRGSWWRAVRPRAP